MALYGSGKNTTSGYKRIDVRFLQKRGYLGPGTLFTLSWKRNGMNIGWIQGRTTNETVILSYKYRRGEVGCAVDLNGVSIRGAHPQNASSRG